MSSGRKRRTCGENPLVLSLDTSAVLRSVLYGFFLAACGVLALRAHGGGEWGGEQGRAVVVGVMVALGAVVMLHVHPESVAERNSRVVLVLGGLVLHVLLVRSVAVLVALNEWPGEYRFLLIPFALVPLTHAVLLGRSMGIYSAVYSGLLGALVTDRGEVMVYLMVSLVAGLVAVQVVHQVSKRVQLLRAGLYVGGVVVVLAWLSGEVHTGPLLESPEMGELREVGVASLVAFGVGVVTAMVVSGFLPVLEGMFGLTTGISWLELSDLNHKLLRRMQLEAPGTFHHSLVVAALAESAAEAIGANAVRARVCAYFHDIGKLNKPEYFIENQVEMVENPHNSLTPTMSALVIISHVKDGIDIAVKHKLNPRIIDVIQEHHGDSLVYYFYRKAQEQLKVDEEKVLKGLGNREDLPQIDQKNFRYPGPRPRTKESGIISLADAVESASRSLRKPTPAKLRALVDDIVQLRMIEGQLNDCPLTMRELARVKDSFAATMRSMLHHRVAYPREEERTAPTRWAATETTVRRQGDPPSGGGKKLVASVVGEVACSKEGAAFEPPSTGAPSQPAPVALSVADDS
jgi:hypothetical protein